MFMVFSFVSSTLSRLLYQGLEVLGAFLPEPEVPQDREHDDHDADDVEDVGHALPPFPLALTLVVTDSLAYWT
jgi:hypothetical protein